jgi:TspO/MBR family
MENNRPIYFKVSTALQLFFNLGNFMKLSNQVSDPDLLRQVTTFVAIVGSILINTFSNFFPLNGVNIGDLSNTLFSAVLVTPANYAFAIWGLIYLGLIAFAVYQMQPTQRHNPRLQRSGYWLAFACVSQCVWIYLFLDRLFLASIIAMFGILLSLICTYQSLGIGQQNVPRQERWFIHIPISIYLGWITVASVVNVAIALYSINWNGWGMTSTLWTVMMMIVSASIAALMTIQRHDTAYRLVIVWALVAIAIRQIDMPLIAMTGTVLAIVLILVNLVVKLTSFTKT